jgi:plasmid stability protein
MTNLSVKDVPEGLAERLRERAMRNHRSLQGELMAILEKAVCEPEPAAPVMALPQKAQAHGDRQPVRRGHKTIEQIAAEHRSRFPQPIMAGPSAVDIIRAERDAR